MAILCHCPTKSKCTIGARPMATQTATLTLPPVGDVASCTSTVLTPSGYFWTFVGPPRLTKEQILGDG